MCVSLLVDAESGGDPLAAFLADGRAINELSIDVEGRLEDLRKVIKNNCKCIVGGLFSIVCTICYLGRLCEASCGAADDGVQASCDGNSDDVEMLRASAAAHHAALRTGTVAVLAGGVDVLYPAENAGLADDIVSHHGARISEQPMGMQPLARHFPMRNRIVSGLARAVVVVEAAAKSGSLITARGALDQGREVLAVPGHPLDARAAGCNMLIRDGAHLVRHVDDVLEALPPLEGQTSAQGELGLPDPAGAGIDSVKAPEPETRTLRQTADLHTRILDRLGPSPLAEDQLIRDLGAASAHVSPALTDLELEGRIRRQPGGFLSLVPR